MAALPVFFALLFIALKPCKIEGASLTDPPTSKSALLYSSARFRCKGTGSDLEWTVAHIPLNSTGDKERNINITTNNMSGNISSNLTIPALPINNKIEIGCIVISVNPFMAVAKEAVLTVTGVSPVENIIWDYESNLMTWSPPIFYSNGSNTHVHPEFVYAILLDGTDRIFTTETRRHLDISNCAQFNVSITVEADKYVSQKNDQVFYDTGPYTIDIKNYTVMVDQSKSTVNISLLHLVKFTNHLCNNTGYIKGSAIHIRDGKVMLSPPVKIISNKMKEIVVEYKMAHLELYSMYTIEIYLKSALNITEDQDNTTISTYNVQNFSIDAINNGLVIVTCVFIRGSIAESCHLVFNDIAQGQEESFNVTEPEQSLILKKSGNYSVSVYDVVHGSIIGPAIEYSKPIEVIIISPSSSYSFEFTSCAYSLGATSIFLGASSETYIIIIAIQSVLLCILLTVITLLCYYMKIRKSCKYKFKSSSPMMLQSVSSSVDLRSISSTSSFDRMNYSQPTSSVDRMNYSQPIMAHSLNEENTTTSDFEDFYDIDHIIKVKEDQNMTVFTEDKPLIRL